MKEKLKYRLMAIISLAMVMAALVIPAAVSAEEVGEGGWKLEYDKIHVLHDDKATLEVKVMCKDGSPYEDEGVTYQWQVYDETEKYFKNMEGKTDSACEVSNVGSYLCRVRVGIQIVDAEFEVRKWTSGGDYGDFFLKDGRVKLALDAGDWGDGHDESDFEFYWTYSPFDNSGEPGEESPLSFEGTSGEAESPGLYKVKVTSKTNKEDQDVSWFHVYYPLEKVDLTLKAPLCGTEAITPKDDDGDYLYERQTNRPVVTGPLPEIAYSGAAWYDVYRNGDDIHNYDAENLNPKIRFDAQNEYQATIIVLAGKDHRWPANTELTVNGQKNIGLLLEANEEKFSDVVFVLAKVRPVHDKDAGTVTRAATTTAEGKKIFKCKGCGTVLERQSIPRLAKKATSVGKPTLTNVLANTSQKTSTGKWRTVSGATGYEMAWRLRGAGKWSTKNVGKTYYAVATKQKSKGLYEYKVRAKKAETATTKAAVSSYSNVLYRYFYTMQKLRFKPEKKAIKVSWAKDSNATGYQILYSTSNKHNDGYGAKVVTLGKNSITEKTVTGLQSGKTYYVQTRAIKKVGKTNYIGNLSNPVAVKVK